MPGYGRSTHPFLRPGFRTEEQGANDLGIAFANYALDTNRLDNAEYDAAWDFTALSLPDGATDGNGLTSIVSTSLTLGGKAYTADAPQPFFGAKK